MQKILTSDKIQLRFLKPEDAPAISRLRSDEIVNRYIERAAQLSEEGALNFINKMRTGIEAGHSCYWAVTTADSDQLIGTVCLWNFSEDRKKAEIGYELATEHHGKGLIREAVRLVLDFTKEQLGLSVVEAYTHYQNDRSRDLLEKNGFRHHGRSGNYLIYQLELV